MVDKHVFVSYKHEDSDFAENLIHRAEKAGFKTWADTDHLHAGEDWRAEIDQAIKNAFALTVNMTPEAKASEYVTYEWAFAWGAGVKVIPVILKPTPLHPRLETLQYLDFTNFNARPWEKLIAVLQHTASTPLAITSLASSISLPPEILQAASLLQAALANAQNQVQADPHISETEKTKESAERINRLVTPRASQQLNRASVLWVDDIPENNTYERQALEALGIQFTVSTSTKDALEKVQREKYDVIISDMGRPGDQKAGYTLLKELKDMGNATPFIIYSASKRPQEVAEARRIGAFGYTNDPQELLELVVNAIKNS